MGGQPDYCQHCGKRLRRGVRRCGHCGTAQTVDRPARDSSRGVSAPQQQRRRQRPRRRERTEDTVTTGVKYLVGVASVVVVIVFLTNVGPLGFGETDQQAGEERTEAFFRAIADGESSEIRTHLHSDSPLQEQLDPSVNSFGFDWEIKVESSEVVERSDDRMVLNVELVTRREELTAVEGIQVELRTEDGTWRVWDFELLYA